MHVLHIDKNAIPYETTVRIDGISFTLTFKYNLHSDMFTVDLARGDEVLVVGEPLIYGNPLFRAFYDERFPRASLVPLDPSGRAERVDWEELDELVFLYMIAPEELDE